MVTVWRRVHSTALLALADTDLVGCGATFAAGRKRSPLVAVGSTTRAAITLRREPGTRTWAITIRKREVAEPAAGEKRAQLMVRAVTVAPGRERASLHERGADQPAGVVKVVFRGVAPSSRSNAPSESE